MSDNPNKPKRQKRDIAKELEHAQRCLLDNFLVGLVEEIEGKVPKDDDLVRHAIYAQFERNPLTTVEKGGACFHSFFVWKKDYCAALAFRDPNNPLALTSVRLLRPEWPPALCAYVDNWYRNQNDQAPA